MVDYGSWGMAFLPPHRALRGPPLPLVRPPPSHVAVVTGPQGSSHLRPRRMSQVREFSSAYTRAVTSPGDPRGWRGWLVTIEGPDGTGKTTQARRLQRHAFDAGLDVVLTREPGGTPIGEQIRSILLDPTVANLDPATDALLFNAARTQLVREVIVPALERGALVISTRFADSTLAYQGYGAGLPIPALRQIEAVATGGLRPDLTILLDLPVEIGLSRKSGHEITRFETEFDVGFHRRVRDGFLALAAAEPGRYVIVDATASVSEVDRAVVNAVGRLSGLSRLVPSDTDGEPQPAPERIHR